MSDKIEEILKNPNIPAMTDEGLALLINHIINNKFALTEPTGLRTLFMNDGRPFTREKYKSEDIDNLEIVVFKQIIVAMKEDLYRYPDFLEQLKAKSDLYKIYEEKDFVELIELVESGKIEEAKVTSLGKFVFERARVTRNDLTGDIFYTELPYITKKQNADKNHFRIYINTSNGENLAEFLREYASRCIQKRIPHTMKGKQNDAEYRTDGTILYVNVDHIEDVLQILEDIKDERPELLETFGSPLSLAHNESYYAITTHPGGSEFTYNDFIDRLTEVALVKVLAERILERHKKTLTSEQCEELEKLAKDETIFDYTPNPKDKMSPFYMRKSTSGVMCKNFYNHYMNQIMSIMELENNDLITLMREKLKVCTSLAYYGDTEHLGHSITFPKALYEKYGIDTTQTKESKNEEISTKKKVSKEQYLSLLKAGRVKLGFELANMGLKAEIEGKSKEELREMLFARIELDDESIIDILSGETEQLCQFVDALGKDDEYEHRSEYEERFIELMGVDRVIDAAYSVRDKDSQLGRNRKWKFKDSLRSVRLTRGKLIFESEEFQKLKTREQRNEFIKNFSEHAKYDVEEYYDLYGKSSTYSK